LDLHLGDRRVAETLVQVLPQLLVLHEELRKAPLRIPARLPGADDPEAEPARMCLLSHGYSLRSTMMVMWLVRLIRGAARPIAAARNRFWRGPSFTYASLTTSSSVS